MHVVKGLHYRFEAGYVKEKRVIKTVKNYGMDKAKKLSQSWSPSGWFIDTS